MADEQTEGEKNFRDAYGSDPAGATYMELERLWAAVQQLDQRLTEIRGIVKEMDPKRMDRLEMKQTLQRIERHLSPEEEEET